MTYYHLNAIAGRNQHPFKDILFTAALLVGLFGTSAAILAQIF